MVVPGLRVLLPSRWIVQGTGQRVRVRVSQLQLAFGIRHQPVPGGALHARWLDRVSLGKTNVLLISIASANFQTVQVLASQRWNVRGHCSWPSLEMVTHAQCRGLVAQVMVDVHSIQIVKVFGATARVHVSQHSIGISRSLCLSPAT
eukprot:COSAG02_NODE_35366_length_469_cov_1.075676_1_plen_146_part_10